MTTRDRATKNTADMDLMLQKVPRQLVEDAKAKCRQESPPVTLKARIVALLKAWTYPTF